MMKHHEDFRREMQRRHQKHTGRDTLLKYRPTFVAALARQPHLDIFGDMLVAKINLLDCSRKVRSLGYDFGVCKVDRP